MIMNTRSARGASAYTQADYYSTRPLDERGLLVSAPCTPPAHTWSQVIDDLLALRKLEHDWDGQGAEAPHSALVDGAISLVQSLQAQELRPADFAVAGVNGTVLFEWHDPSGYLEIEVTAPDQAEVRWVRKGSDVAEVFTLSRRQ